MIHTRRYASALPQKQFFTRNKLKINTMGLVAASLATGGFCSATTVMIGPGSGLGGTAVDTTNEDRLNVDQTAKTLAAGIYNVDSWSLSVRTHDGGTDGDGTITPMLLTGSPSTYTTLWLGTAFDPTSTGVQSIAQSGTFTLAAATDVYVGFFTQDEGSDIIGFSNGVGNTSHDNSFTVPTGVGQTVGSFSHGLTRSYNLDITVTQVPEPGSVALLGLGGALCLMRRRRDAKH